MTGMCWYCMARTAENGVCSVCGRSPHATDPDVLPPGSVLDNGSVVVGEVLGKGGFGVTYVAFDRMKDRKVALKEFRPNHLLMAGRPGGNLQVIPAKLDVFEKCRRSFVRESRLLNQLSHPHIVKVFFTIEEHNTCYYGMELLNGEDMRHRIRDTGIMSGEEACRTMLPVMQAVAYLHENKTLHRDISPANIVLRKTPSGTVPCLIDFGAAYTAKDDFTHTVTNVMTPGFSPPEQMMSAEYMRTYTDIYSLCATLYYMTTGTIPPPSDARLLQDNVHLVPAHEINPDLPRAFSDVLSHGMELKWEERIQDIPALTRELATVYPELFGVKTLPWWKKLFNSLCAAGKKTGQALKLKRKEKDQLKKEKERVLTQPPPEEKKPEFYCRSGTYKGNRLPILDGMLFGKAPTSNVTFNDPTVSRQHFFIQIINGQTVLRDMNSTNGTFVNGVRLPKGGEKVLENGDMVQIGHDHIFEYVA